MIVKKIKKGYKVQEIISWLESKVLVYSAATDTWDKGSEEYGYNLGAMEAFEDVLEKLKKGN
jgi:hypothetical protein